MLCILKTSKENSLFLKFISNKFHEEENRKNENIINLLGNLF
ncbi:hypothetical protein LEP1GSC193_4303 [Leptospira alstonii serovar Pingchang str. 80-412]|uniref:Uncharacterized protein n=2 Tax=Leptospira alstonii TaxID=28452 RepID=M6CK13_9LEPT|nr:hypothetical protein LEP1GSC194_1411 [Leptospira alstonii serovar Sichuan str. 79601]EQA80360.1 hypothetical protein LEP1GSC193_4303 [Leptospira alstonii serovar Pingchang str. 80-412]